MKKTAFIVLFIVIGIVMVFPQPGYSSPGWVVGAAAALIGIGLINAATCPGYAYYGPPAGYAYPPPAYAPPPPPVYAYPYRYYYGPRYHGYYGPRYHGYYGYRY